MPTFQYLAYDADGKRLKSSSAADSERQLRRELKSRGIFVSSVKRLSAGEGGRERSLWRRSVSLADLSQLIRQLAILLNAGIALDEAFQLISDQTENSRQKSVVESWREGVLAGYSFSEAIKKSPYPVDDKLIAAIGVAEETGHLHQVLDRMADDLELGNDNRQTLVKGMIYPAVMIVVAIVVIGVMVGYVVPQVAKVFVNARQELPLLTRATIGASDFLRGYGLYLVLGIAAAFTLFLFLLRDRGRRTRWHRSLLKMPVVGQWILIANLADWCRSMGTLLASGVSAMPALTIASAGMGNLHLKNKMEAVREKVRQGNSLSQGLKSERFVPGFLLHMVGSGESSGELDRMLLKVSDYYTARLRNTVETLLKLLEPALIVFMGLVVLLIVGAVLVPIVKMNQLI